MNAKKLLRFIPLLLLVLAIILAFVFGLDQYLSFQWLKAHRDLLLNWTAHHYALVVLLYICLYILSVTLSLPGAVFLTLAGGFLFGPLWGIVYVVVSATIGATFLFLIVQFAIGDWLSKKASSWVGKLQHGFQENALQYLLVLRLVPIFPFWVVNIVPGVLNIKKSTFVVGTFLGVIPGSFVYVLIGNGLDHIFASGKTPSLGIIFEPQVLLPLIGLAILSLIPVFYKRLKAPKEKDDHAKQDSV